MFYSWHKLLIKVTFCTLKVCIVLNSWHVLLIKMTFYTLKECIVFYSWHVLLIKVIFYTLKECIVFYTWHLLLTVCVAGDKPPLAVLHSASCGGCVPTDETGGRQPRLHLSAGHLQIGNTSQALCLSLPVRSINTTHLKHFASLY